jgi:hypothetical protein
VDSALSLLVFALLMLPPGYAALRLAGSRGTGPGGLAAALGLGWAIVLPLVLLETMLGGRYLILPIVVVCLVWLRPGREALRQARTLLPDLVLPLALGLLFHLANASDFALGPAGASMRLGFDVGDRISYSLVADELLRAAPHRLENPLFAPLPMQYSLWPALAGLLLRAYAGASGLAAFVWQQPAIGAVCVGVAVAGLLGEWGAPRAARLLTTLLVVLGGDLSFLTATLNRTGLERSGHFFAFYSFSAESLLYNPWVWGLPIALVSLILAGRYLEGGRRADLVLCGLVLGALWQTKVFAFLALVAAAALAALATRRVRLAAVAAAGLVGGAPWLLLTALSPGGRGGWPLSLEPLRAVRASLEVNATLRSAAGLLGDSGPAMMALAALLFLAGGLGVRLAGLPRLWREARRDPGGAHALAAAAVAVSVVASLALRGQPMAIDGIQFLTFAQYLLWLYAGPALAALAARGAWPVAVGLAGLALVAPVRSLAEKMAPERFTAPGSLDRVRVVLRPATVAACEWLRTTADPRDRVLLSLDGDPEDVGGVKPLLVAALSRRRVSVYGVPLGVSMDRVIERREWTRRVFEATGPGEVQEALDRLGAQWVWEDAAHPLRVTPPGWEAHQPAPGVRLLRRKDP